MAKDAEALKRENTLLDRFAVAVIEFQAREGISDRESASVLWSHAAHVLGHSDFRSPEEFARTLVQFTAAVRRERFEHMRNCVGSKGAAH